MPNVSSKVTCPVRLRRILLEHLASPRFNV
jgi:hypothetical protein